MKVVEALKILDHSEILNLDGNSLEYQVEQIIEIFVSQFLPDTSISEFMPYLGADGLDDYFEGWDISWLEMLNGQFLETVELEIDSITLNLLDQNSVCHSKAELEELIMNTCGSWQSKTVNAFREAIRREE